MKFVSQFTSLSLCIFLGLVAVSWSADEKDAPPEITAEKAREYVGKKVTVVMEVKKAKYSEKRDTVFLDSEADFKDSKNLGGGDRVRRAQEIQSGGYQPAARTFSRQANQGHGGDRAA